MDYARKATFPTFNGVSFFTIDVKAYKRHRWARKVRNRVARAFALLASHPFYV